MKIQAKLHRDTRSWRIQFSGHSVARARAVVGGLSLLRASRNPGEVRVALRWTECYWNRIFLSSVFSCQLLYDQYNIFIICRPSYGKCAHYCPKFHIDVVYVYKLFFAPTLHISSLMTDCFVLIRMSINLVLSHKFSKMTMQRDTTKVIPERDSDPGSWRW